MRSTESQRPHAVPDPPPGEAMPPASDEDLLRGSGQTPWVRYERAGERGHASASPGRSQPPLPDLSTLLVALEALRGMVPRELSTQVSALVREALLTLRALIDWYLERLDGDAREPEVEEIPID